MAKILKIHIPEIILLSKAPICAPIIAPTAAGKNKSNE